MSDPVLSVRDLCRHYVLGGETVRALDGVDFDIARGEYVAIIGPSGSGKSTLMNLLGCLDSPTRGSYRLEGREVAGLTDDELAAVRNQRIGFVFQSFHLLPRQTAAENVALPLLYAGQAGSALGPARQALAKVRLEDRADHHPNELSGGQRQRVAIARALVTRPAIVLADEPTGNLDSNTSAEILSLLDDLHSTGTTLIVVTHDPEVASRAERVLRVRDGKLVEDRRNRPAATRSLAGSAAGDLVARRGPGLGTLLDLARASLVASRMRTALSVLGVVIGVGAVIAMLGLGHGARSSVSERIASLGTHLLSVRPGVDRGRQVRSGAVQTLVPEDLEAILARVPLVVAGAPEAQGQAQAKYLAENRPSSVTGTTPAYLSVLNYTLSEGRFLDDADVAGARKVCVLGATPAKELFGELPAVGERIKLKGSSYEVVGVLTAKGQGGFQDPDDLIVVPVSTAMRKLFGNRFLRALHVSVKDRESMTEATAAIEAVLRERHRIREGADDDFHVRSQEELLQTMTEVTETFTLLLAGIAAVSLLVGGIGIMNIMLVSVTERTREIGIRKALGATRSDVLRQFLSEAIVVTLAGGIAGIGAGLLAARILAALSGWVVVVPGYAYPLAFGFSAAIGLFFGAYPAARAARLDPIECLRHE